MLFIRTDLKLLGKQKKTSLKNEDLDNEKIYKNNIMKYNKIIVKKHFLSNGKKNETLWLLSDFSFQKNWPSTV